MAIRPGKYNPLKPDIELFDYKSKKRYGLKLEGSGALQIGTISQDDSVHIRAAGKRIGDFDEQRSWKGGRGIEDLSSNPTGYWDSQNAWTLTDGHVHQTLLWQFAKGLRNMDFFMPSKTRSVYFRSLLGTYLWRVATFTSTGVTADYALMWIRRVGNPGTLTLKLHSNSSNLPGTVLKTVTVTTDDITDTVSVLHRFDWTGTETLANGTKYHLSLSGATTDNQTNHWEVGVSANEDDITGIYSPDGSNWAGSGARQPFMAVSEADPGRTYFPFFMDDAFYLVSYNDNGSNSQVWINGDRGNASSGGATSITDSSKAWVVNRWTDAYVKIVRGTGAGQTNQIVSNTSTALTVLNEWDVNPASDSDFVIYATEWFTEVLTTGLGQVLSQPLVVNRMVYFPQGASVNTRIMIWNSTTGAHSFSNDGTNRADFLLSSSDQTGVRVWRCLNSTSNSVSFATATAYNTTPVALTFGASKEVGDTSYKITGMNEKDGLIYIFKENGAWTTNPSLILTKLVNGMDKTPYSKNGSASLVHGGFLYHTWMHSLIRIYGSSHDDIGQDWSGYGLPDTREGYISSLDSYTSLLIAGVCALNGGTSSVLGWDGLGWHELLRAYSPNRRIRMVKVQPCEDTRNRMWVAVGANVIFQEMPFMKGSPRLDSGVRYMHEGVVESSAIDMGTASGLAKFIKELVVYCENLGGENEIRVDYQVDDDVHTSNWTDATTLFEAPEATAFLGLNNIRKFAYRLRILSSDNTQPVDVLGVIPNGYARAPYKMVWTLRCRADNVTSRGRIVKPDALMRWLLDNARYPGRIEMQSQYELAHKYFVIIHPPRMFPYKPAQNGQAEESVFTIVLEEA